LSIKIISRKTFSFSEIVNYLEMNILSLLPSELQDLLKENYGVPKFRGTQVFQWLYKGIHSFSEMRNLPQVLREKLDQDFIFPIMTIQQKQISTDGTIKYLVKCPFDSNLIEAVVLKYHHGYTACISTQVGCAMHCSFCASGRDGMVRNLEAGEMIQQILTLQTDINSRISNIVLMGSGEPLDNYDNVVQFLKIVHESNGLNIGYRHITISTCGIVPKIYDLAKLSFPITLAISLHASTDAVRNQIMPINRKYPLEALIEACSFYFNQTKRRITYEYALIADLNDSEEIALSLADLLKNLNCHVNLIPVNPTDRKFTQPKSRKIENFQKILEQNGIACTIRREMGSDIDAACGQLKNSFLESEK
jgi:23S rRNA (adenine2503-C2)-methyltransferase